MGRNTSSLEDWEVSLIKGMMVQKRFEHDQEILAYFSRPERTVNNGRLSEIRKALAGEPIPPQARKYAHQPVASREQVEAFLAQEGRLDPRTGLDRERDELVIKAREAMLLAVQGYNNPTCYFKSEMFIVSACIAWTYLLLAYYHKKGKDMVRQRKGGPTGKGDRPNEYAPSLKELVNDKQCPLSEAVKANLLCIIEIRNAIAHRGIGRIDAAISDKLQACALNFDAALRKHFGQRCGLGQDLGVAIQFARLDTLDHGRLRAMRSLPNDIRTVVEEFEGRLSKEIVRDPAYACRVKVQLIETGEAGAADEKVRVVSLAEAKGDEPRVVMTERTKLRASDIVKTIQDEGYRSFNMHHFIKCWQSIDGRNPEKGLGVDVAGSWYWYEEMIEEVRKYCKQVGNRFR